MIALGIGAGASVVLTLIQITARNDLTANLVAPGVMAAFLSLGHAGSPEIVFWAIVIGANSIVYSLIAFCGLAVVARRSANSDR